MDPRQHSENAEYAAGSSTPGGGPAYTYHGGQNDSFSSFINTDTDSTFDASSWSNQPFSATQQPTTGYGQSSASWPQTPYQNPASSYLPLAQFGTFSEDNSSTYPGNSSFQYPNFDSAATQAFPSSLYNDPSAFGSLPLTTDPHFDYANSQEFPSPNQTISPQALQNYSQFPQPPPENKSNTQTPRPAHAPVRKSSAGGTSYTTPLTHQDWLNIASRTVKSIEKGGLHIKPTSDLSSATNSKRFDATIPRYRRKKSRNETLQLLYREKGDEPWHRDREPLVKKLKTTASKHAGLRPTLPTIQGRSPLAADSASSSDSDSDSDDESEDYSESGRESEPEEPSPLPAIRPADPSKAVEYDIIKTVWRKRSAALPGSVIRIALTDCWNIFKGVRDKWKAKMTSLVQAIEKKDQATKNAFERRVVEQRRLLESCIRLTLKHGHPSIVEKVGESPILLVVLYQFLADRFKESVYTGSLIASILELMERCSSIDLILLEKTKWDKALPRIVKRGDDQGKILAQRIMDNAKVATEQKGLGEHATSAPQSNGTATRRLGVDGTDAKKGKVGDLKKAADDITAKASGTTTAKVTATKSDSKTSKPILGDKAKASHVPGKPSGFFSSLQSASKKPGTSTKSKDGKAASEPEKKSESTAPVSKPAFSFAATMADLAKAKEAPPAKSEETRKPETPEERQKRLRKEERRKLRVSFKADEDLVQVRLFVHDPEEEIGHDHSQVRDVGDSRGEGQMLKMHKDLEVLDDEDEYEPPEEIPQPWITPQPIDFSVLKTQLAHEDLEKIYTTRGGPKESRSEERSVQEQREKNTLMVVYSSYSDIPDSPREPADLNMSDYVSEKDFGPPPEVIKMREAEYHARRNAQVQAAPPQAPDISALLRLMNAPNQAQQPQQPEPPPAPVPAPSSQLEAIFAKFATNNQQAPPQMPVAHQQPVAPAFDLQTALAGMQHQNQHQTYQPQPAYSAAQPAQMPNLQAILAQFGTQAMAPAPQAQVGIYDMNSYQQEHDRKRQFETDEGEYGYSKGKRARGSGTEEKKPYTGPPREPCKFWPLGKCRKGDNCTYLHDPQALFDQ